ncbi:hypothetical protein [Desulfuromonas sp.]|uniref:hypothetical protein n=1 Tax=Desulfuromonas sp. TaxID=892 RepID=UPI0025C502BF|nr:hypothetical protein [Desulfuromonas sp.]
MVQIDLNSEEQKILIDTLNNDISNLGMEIAGTDLLDYREMLKERRETLAKVLMALQ